MNDFKFIIECGDGEIIVDGDHSVITICQRCSDDDIDREPGDIDVVYMPMSVAREFLQKLSEVMASMPDQDDQP